MGERRQEFAVVEAVPPTRSSGEVDEMGDETCGRHGWGEGWAVAGVHHRRRKVVEDEEDYQRKRSLMLAGGNPQYHHPSCDGGCACDDQMGIP